MVQTLKMVQGRLNGPTSVDGSTNENDPTSEDTPTGHC